MNRNGEVWSKLAARWRFASVKIHRVSIYRRPYGSRYCVVSLRENSGTGKVTCRYVHRLVLEAFVGPCPPGLECLHRDHDTANNRLRNLRWGTRTENIEDKVKAGRARGRFSKTKVQP